MGHSLWAWRLQQTKSFTVDIRAKPEYHKFLIGKGGGKIRKVRDSTGARIIFPTAEDKDQDLITIVGREDAVREAQKELEALIQSLVGPTAHPFCPALPRPSHPACPPADGLWCARTQDNVVEDCMLVDPRHHRHFVIRRGQVLREIAEEYGGVMVSFPRSGTQSDKVTLKGAKDCVEAAKKRILEIIEDLVGGGVAPGRPSPPVTSPIPAHTLKWGGVGGFEPGSCHRLRPSRRPPSGHQSGCRPAWGGHRLSVS